MIRTFSMKFAILAMASIAAVSPVFSQTAPDLARPRGGETVDVLVQYANSPTETDHKRVTSRRGRVKASFDRVGVTHYAVTAESLAELESNPNVVSISPNRPISGFLDRVSASTNQNQLASYYNSIGRPKGGGIGVAIIDSGMQINHRNFYAWKTTNNRVAYSESFVGSDGWDHFGHGTHVAGILGGTDNVSNSLPSTPIRQFWGMATGVSFINLQVLDANGNGSDAAVIAAINRAIQLKSTYNIRVINLSLGRPIATSYKTDPLCQAVEQAWKAGIVVVVAAGNDGRNNSAANQGYGTITAPGNDPYVITVGASNDKGDFDRANDVIASYSSKGPTAIDHLVKPDLVAPGNRVVSYQAWSSTLTSAYGSNWINDSVYDPKGTNNASPYYFTLSGTSMATPVVAGAAVYLLDKNPSLTPDQVKAKLMKTAWRGFPATMSTTDPTTGVTYTANHDAFTIGAGQVDFWAAYNDTDLPAGSAASPSVSFNSSNRTVQMALNPTSAQSVIWGTNYATSVIWGTNVSGNSVIWGSSIIWGTSSVAGFSIIWGTTSPWALSVPGAESTAVAIQGEP